MNIKETNSLIELYFEKFEQTNKKKSFLKWLNPKNNRPYNWEEVTERIYKLSYKIKNFIKEGDRVLLLSENRPEWLISDLAIMNAGGITVPIFTTYADKDYEFILKDCDPSLIILSNEIQLKKINKYIKDITIISFEKLEKNTITLESIFQESFEKKINQKLKRESPACIIYTSGTSGNPKGVILSHGGILSNCEGAVELLEPLINKRSCFFNLVTFITFL